MGHGDSGMQRSYDHVAFKIQDSYIDEYTMRIKNMKLGDFRGRERAVGEGRSIYFHDCDNHLFKLNRFIIRKA